MEKIQILAIGRAPLVLQKLSVFMNENPEWQSTATVDDRTAIQLFDLQKFDVVIFIGLENESEQKLRDLFSQKNPGIIFVNHVGDSPVILASQLQKALDKKRANA